MHFDPTVSIDLFDCLGYRMAVECARDALLQKVMDNKEDAGLFFCSIFVQPKCVVSLASDLFRRKMKRERKIEAQWSLAQKC